MCVAVPGPILQLCHPRRQQPNVSPCCTGDVRAAWPHCWGWGAGGTVPPGSTTAPRMGHLLSPSREERLGTALLFCRDGGHLQAGNLVPAVSWTYSAHAPLPGTGTWCSHRAPRQGDLPSWVQQQRGTLPRGPQRAPQDPCSWLDRDCENKAFLTGVQPRDPETPPALPGLRQGL